MHTGFLPRLWFAGLSLMLASPVRGWKKQDTYTDSCGHDAMPFWIIPMPFMQGVVSDVRQSCQADGSSRWGVAYSRVSTFSGDYLRVTDNKGKTHDVLTGSDDARHSNTSLAWGAGVQFNPTESVAVDVAYEGSGSGNWRTDGFIVGVGYKF